MLHARRLIMSAYLYYQRSSPVLSDGDYDKLSLEVADRWHDLSPILQFQLGSQEAIRASGSHILITRAGEGGALAWHRAVRRFEADGQAIDQWLERPEFPGVGFGSFSG